MLTIVIDTNRRTFNMKKCILILVILSLLLTGCSLLKSKPVLQVGFAQVDITPTESLPLRGYGRSQNRLSQNVLDPLMATALAITDGTGQTILIIGVDLCSSGTPANFRGGISKETGIPVENILICSSHTHSGPDTTATGFPGVSQYVSSLRKQLIQVSLAALEDRQNASMFGATVQTTGLNFVRRYILNDGTFGGDNYGDFSSGIKDHESEADGSMQLVKFTREGKPDVILTNFQTHPHRTGGSKKYDISADIVGAYRKAMNTATGANVVYITGASGNINPTSRIEEENQYDDYLAHGQAMADAALTAQYQPLAVGNIQVTTQTPNILVNHEFDQYAPILKPIYERWNSGELTTAEFNALANEAVPIKINSPYHANAIVTRAQRKQRESFGISAFSFGEVSIIGAPYEMFDQNGMQIKERSPFAMTIIATCTNGSVGYIPSQLGYTNGGYSVDTTRFEPGTGELLTDRFISMLRLLHKAYAEN